MRLHRFYIKEEIPDSGEVFISDPKLSHQLGKVLRYSKGDLIILFNGNGKEYSAIILLLDKKGIQVSIEGISMNLVSARMEVTLFQSVLKKDKLEWVVQKGAEIGMTRFVPVITDRSEKLGFNLERMEKIAVEATEQSGRGMPPELVSPISLLEAWTEARGTVLVFHSSGEPLSKIVSDEASPVSIFIGPEGGWSEKEIEFFKEQNARVASLGEATLRGETASLAALSVILLS